LRKQDLEQEEKNKLLAEQIKLTNELALAKTKVSSEDIEQLKAEQGKSETQKIIDRISKETQAQEIAIANQRILIAEKTAQNAIDEALFQKQITDKENELKQDLLDIKNR